MGISFGHQRLIQPFWIFLSASWTLSFFCYLRVNTIYCIVKTQRIQPVVFEIILELSFLFKDFYAEKYITETSKDKIHIN